MLSFWQVLKRVKKYLKLLGRKIEIILQDHAGAKNFSSEYAFDKVDWRFDLL